MPIDFEPLVKTIQIDGAPHVLVRPGLSICLYSATSLPTLGPHVSAALDAYLESIAPAALKSYLAPDGYYKKLTTKRVATDKKNLGNVSDDCEAFSLEYSQGEEGEAGTHAFFFRGSKFDEDFPTETSLLRLEFPPEVIERPGAEAVLDFIARIACMVPFQSGNAGFAFKRSQLYFPESTSQINAMLPRYLGFDPSYHPARESLRGHTFSAHWVNLFGGELLGKVGGIKSVKEALPPQAVRELEGGIMIRSSRLPAVGDANRKALDVGKMPAVARLLKATRVKIKGFGQPAEVFDAMAWLARFDKMSDLAWDNTKA